MSTAGNQPDSPERKQAEAGPEHQAPAQVDALLLQFGHPPFSPAG